MDGQVRQVHISTSTLVKLLLIVLGMAFLYLIKDILLVLFAAVILAAAFDPTVDWLEAKKLPRGLSMVIIFLLVFFVLGLLVVAIAPVLAEQFTSIARHFPEYYEAIIQQLTKWDLVSGQVGVGQISSQISNFLSFQGLFTTVGSVFGGIFSFLTVLVLTFYF
ncbi:MAG: AI-2E family transporter, partial [bacterium]